MIAGNELFGGGSPADQMATLQDYHAKAGASQVSRCYQPIVAGSDYDDIAISVFHMS
jgi:hypothetical protein